MILIFGGTTEGRVAVEVIETAGKPYFYSTQGTDQQIDCRQENTLPEHGCRGHDGILPGAPDSSDRRRRPSVCNRPAPQYLRNRRPAADSGGPIGTTIPSSSPRDRLVPGLRRRHHATGTSSGQPTAALTGVNSLAKLRSYWQQHDCWFRILRREASEKIRAQVGFPAERILFYEQDGVIDPWLIRLLPDAILLKESGESGGFTDKVNAALRHGVQVFATNDRRCSPPFRS